MIIAFISLIGGLVGLVIAGAGIVTGASTIGLRLGLPPLVVGLTIVAAGTSAPELAVTWLAASAGDPDLAMGNVVGSNIANILLVLGLVAIIGVIPISRRARRVEFPVMIAASILTAGLALDGTISRLDGAILVAGLIAYLSWMIADGRRQPSGGDRGDGGDGGGGEGGGGVEGALAPTTKGTLLGVLYFLLGVGGVAISAQFVVSGAEEIALELGVPQLVVGLTVLAIGTSAPEVATSVIAAMRGEREVAIGNAIGSNVFNLLFVLGVVSMTTADIPVEDELIRLDLPIMIVVAVLCVPLGITAKGITRWEGVAFVAMYAAYLTYLVLNGLENAVATPFGIVALVTAGVGVPLIATLEFRRERRSGFQPTPEWVGVASSETTDEE
jgi:cation:H+ antiporter